MNATTGNGKSFNSSQNSSSSNSGGGTTSPDFLVSPGGDVIPIPENAKGPTNTRSPGCMYSGGTGGGNLLHDYITGVRIMEPISPRNNVKGYPNGYVCYMNK